MILDRFWSHLGLQVGRPSVPKSCKNLQFFKIFGFLAILPTRGHMIHFLANLALNMRLKTLQNSTQDASKIDQKSIPTSIKILIKILIGFWSNFGPTWPQKPPKMEPGGAGNSSRFGAWMGLGGLLGALGAQDLPRGDFWTQRGPTWPQHGLNLVQLGPNWAPPWP